MNKSATNKNPYIQYHKSKIDNDKNYHNYLEWLKNKGEGVPVNKVVMPEDYKAEIQYRKLL